MKVVDIQDHGSIVMVIFAERDGKTLRSMCRVPFDRRQFGYFLEGIAGKLGVEQGGTVDFRGLEFEVDDNEEGGHVVRLVS